LHHRNAARTELASAGRDADPEVSMKVESILRAKGRQVSTIQPWAKVEQAISQLMGPPRIGALVVTGVPRGFTGMITERDIIRGMKMRGADLLTMPVSSIMTHHVPTCSPTDSIADVMMKMTRSRYRHLPVLDGGELVGLVSIGDVVRVRVDEMELETGVLRDLYVAKH
jgi:CBS domain-containing protein